MSMWWRMLVAVGVAAFAAGAAALADSKPWATVIWAGIGGVGTAFAPTIWERWKAGQAAGEAMEDVAELLPEGPAALLHPLRAVVPFTGREQELEQLLAWCADPDAERLRLLVGPGGVGKSRLAVELATRLEPLWGAVEVRDDTEAQALSKWRVSSGDRLLIVVDYAETRTELAALLQEVAADIGRRVRVLLLARSAGEWWRQLGAQSVRVRQMVAAAGQGLLLAEEVQERASDRQVVAEAVPHFAKALRVAVPRRIEVELSEGPQRILDLHAAALVIVLRSMPQTASQVGPVTVSDVLEELLGHERRFWLQSAQARGFFSGPQGLSTTAIEQIVAAGTFLGARNRVQAAAVVGRVPDGTASARVADWLRELYPPDMDDDQQWLGRLRPDRLAELHITRQLSNCPELLTACLKDLDAQQRRRALVTLAQAAQELDDAGEMVQQLLPDVADEVGTVSAPRETLVALYEVLPYPSLILADSHAMLAQRILDSIPDDAEDAERARWLSAAGLHLSDLGRLADAFSYETEAVAIRRRLVNHYPSLHYPGLAASLANLAATFSDLGRPADALPVINEACTIYRKLTDNHPGQYQSRLADAVSKSGIYRAEAGHPLDALPSFKEALSIYRDLAESHPERYRSGLASSLNNLGTALAELGKHADSLPLTREAAAIYRELAERNPDRYQPSLAHSLTGVGTRLVDLGKPEDALSVTEEAFFIYRELAERYPDRYRSNLSDCLSNMGVYFFALGRTAEALRAEQQAMNIRRELSTQYPDRYLPHLARSLSNLGNYYSTLSQHDEALSVEKEAVAIYRELTILYPDRHLNDLASTLSQLGLRFSELGHPVDSLAAAKESILIHRELSTRYSDRYLPKLAGSLSNFGVCCSSSGKYGEALDVEKEAVAIYRELTIRYPDRYRADLAISLSNLGSYYSEIGQAADALHEAKEAVVIFREVATLYPDRYRPSLARALLNLSTCLSKLDRFTEALPLAEEAVAIYRNLTVKSSRRYRPYLVRSLRDLSNLLAKVGREEEADEALDEAWDIVDFDGEEDLE
ncbi:tetratricopeptide repeat protein [Streptosporangium sp. CA-135522]|uniref:tetratricopeptide repeat protein n=1 Tax=Streptosporangium sp. CA-135522 TaxID=3240072 RepID=UPI003D8FE53E